MRLARTQSHSAGGDTPVLQRGATFIVVAAVHILLLLLLLRLAPPTEQRREAPMAPISVRLIPEARVAPTPLPAPKGRAAPSGSARPARLPVAMPEPKPPPPPAPPAPSQPSEPPVYIIPLTRSELAAADIGRMPSRGAPTNGSGSGESGSSIGRESGDAGPGRGPNGEPLYNADWQRRPTRAELAFYMPRNAPPAGWGMIACQTVAGYRVEDCRIIAESPVGSGLARAVQQAAWQFRVLPPRIGGKALVGTWVRIRIDYTQEGPE